MLFELTGTEDLSKDDIENLKAHVFKIEFKKVDENRTDLYNTHYRINIYYNLFIDILTLTDLISICNILQHELIISKNAKSEEYNRIEVYNGYRE